MKEFFVGSLVIVAAFVLAGLGVLLLPFLLVLGLALRVLVIILLGLLAIWLVGKLVLMFIDAVKGKDAKKV